MTTDEIKAAARRFVMEHNQPNYVASLDELCAPDVKVHEYLPGLPEPMDRSIYNGFLAGFRAALPDIHNSVEDVVCDGDRVAVRWRGFGTHTGEPLMGLPAKGCRVEAHGTYVLRFQDGRIAEVWNNWDNANVMTQLGA
jgi:predicted ester cyclase